MSCSSYSATTAVVLCFFLLEGLPKAAAGAIVSTSILPANIIAAAYGVPGYTTQYEGGLLRPNVPVGLQPGVPYLNPPGGVVDVTAVARARLLSTDKSSRVEGNSGSAATVGGIQFNNNGDGFQMIH